ncbi:MAG: HU family DNA-binding protein [Polyangiales bacterium]
MTKSELIEAIAQKQGITKGRAELVVNCVFSAMTDAMAQGDHIEIRGFGSFSIRDYRPYTGRNPRTNEPVAVGAKKLPFFKVGKELKELVNDSLAASVQIAADHEPDETDAEPDDDHDDE